MIDVIIILNQETAVVSYICNLMKTAAKLNQKREDNSYCLRGARIKPDAILAFAECLQFANCGPVLKQFDRNSLIKLFERCPQLFRKEIEHENEYCLAIEKEYMFDTTDENVQELRRDLIRILKPVLNYPVHFLEAIGIIA